MEDIGIPMLHGNMEDISQESSTLDASLDSSSVIAQQIYDRESRSVVVFCTVNAYCM